MEIKTNEKIRVRLESFNHELLTSSCRKLIDLLQTNDVNKYSMVSLPTDKRIYCVLRSPHVDKDSREHFEIRIHKRILDISYDPSIKVDRRYVFYDNNIPFRRSGTYPNGERSQKYKGKSVVSERSVRQIDSMIKDKEKYQFAIVFLVNRGDCTAF